MKHYNSNKIKRSASFSWRTMMIALLCLLTALPMSAQNRMVQGTVIDNTGEPVIGANIRVSGTTRGTITDIDGVFKIEASAKDKLTAHPCMVISANWNIPLRKQSLLAMVKPSPLKCSN
mgnify:CR=1 FL=1